jgi:hypothetical protein
MHVLNGVTGIHETADFVAALDLARRLTERRDVETR